MAAKSQPWFGKWWCGPLVLGILVLPLAAEAAWQTAWAKSGIEDKLGGMQPTELEPLGDSTEPAGESERTFNSEYGAYAGTGLEGRSAAARAHRVREAGGTAESEAAVTEALAWLANHQQEDGSWSYEFPAEGEAGHVADGGTLEAPNQATGLALLAFLAAGNSHLEGPYKNTVKKGFNYLLQNMRVAGDRGDLSDDGGMASHGMCTLALCEACVLTQDRDLLRPAQMALNHIVHAQDETGGGWSHEAGEAGNTKVTAWQLMALKAGHMAYLDIPPATVTGASKFLDSVAREEGARYGFAVEQQEPDQTGPGLLMRMFLGWKPDHPALEEGVEFLADEGPSERDVLFNFYANQVLYHNGGEEWENWNPPLRDALIESQSQDGALQGSWYFDGGDQGPTLEVTEGGRLYSTAMGCLMLEIYYRQMPLYGSQDEEEEFPM